MSDVQPSTPTCNVCDDRGSNGLFGDGCEWCGRRLARCHAGSDGDCVWEHCPQLRDREPHTSGRHCPIDVIDEEY